MNTQAVADDDEGDFGGIICCDEFTKFARECSTPIPISDSSDSDSDSHSYDSCEINPPINCEWVEDRGVCCNIFYPRGCLGWDWIGNQRVDDLGYDSSHVSGDGCCEHWGEERGVETEFTDRGGSECCYKGTGREVMTNKYISPCCRLVKGASWYSFAIQGTSNDSNEGACCRNAGGVAVDGSLEKNCCAYSWVNDTCCEGLYNKAKSQTSDQFDAKCCGGEGAKLYWPLVTSDNGRDLDYMTPIEPQCCEKGKFVKTIPNANGAQLCCANNGPVYVTDVRTFPGDIGSKAKRFSCCEKGAQVYVPNGDSLKEACCSGKVYPTGQNKSGKWNYGCCKDEGTVHERQDGFSTCCEKGTTLVEQNGLEQCCKNSTDNLYLKLASDLSDGHFTSCCDKEYIIVPAKDAKSGESYCCKPELAQDSTGTVREECCTNAGGTWNNGTCCKGSWDLGGNIPKRSEACCTNAGGKWMETFCCATWGTKDGESCKAEELPSDGPDQESE